MQAVILAGGAGTRLRSIVNDRPKPMACFGDKPFLEHQIDSLRLHGVTDVVLCTGYMHDHIENHFEDGARWGIRVSYSREWVPLGTGGAIRHAMPLLRGSFLLLNGDSFLELDVQALAKSHAERRRLDSKVVGTLALTRVPDARGYGSVEMDDERRIVRYREKSTSTSPWISAGVYALEPEIFERWPVDTAISLEKDVIPDVLDRGGKMCGHPADGFFVDIGTPDGFRSFRNYIEGNGHGHS